ncbi:unnamed protein product [Effrenium voratum]|nr:unnamed protein product [Effrenium voratum]
MSAESSDGWVRVADSTALEQCDRAHVQVEGRFVSVLRARDGLHCIDSVCYHTGGPLTIGDIEDINGDLCVRCPWHDYSVRLSDGAKPYQAMKLDPKTKKLSPDGWKYTKSTQRTHEVLLRDGAIFVRLSTRGKFESDQFAYNASAAKNVSSGDNSFRPDGKGPGGYKRSGEVLAEHAKASSLAPPDHLPPRSSMPPAKPPAEKVYRMDQDWRAFRFLSKKQLTSNMWRFRFALTDCLGWPEVERHVRLRFAGETLEREYTPVSPLGQANFFDLAIKVYPDGALTPRLLQMKPGQHVEMCGPHGDLTISWASKTAMRAGQPIPFDGLALVVGGSAVTVALQLLQDWLVKGDACRSLGIDIVYACRFQEELAFRAELEELTRRCPNIRLLLSVSQAPADWPGVGRLDAAALQWLHKKALPIVCGPPAFNEAMKESLASLDFDKVICL